MMQCAACGAERKAGQQRCECGQDFPEEGEVDARSIGCQVVDPMRLLLVSGAELRKCGKCGTLMKLYLVENVYLNGVMPSGQRKYFRCLSCGKEIKIRSAWRLCLVSLGLPFFPFVLGGLYPFNDIWGIVILVIFAVYPLVLIKEIYVRLTNPPATMENCGKE